MAACTGGIRGVVGGTRPPRGQGRTGLMATMISYEKAWAELDRMKALSKEHVMSSQTSIEWTEQTWNPILGCSIISPGCHNCYAMSMARRLKAMALADIAAGRQPGRKRHYIDVIGPDGRWNGKLVLVPEALADPL